MNGENFFISLKLLAFAINLLLLKLVFILPFYHTIAFYLLWMKSCSHACVCVNFSHSNEIRIKIIIGEHLCRNLMISVIFFSSCKTIQQELIFPAPSCAVFSYQCKLLSPLKEDMSNRVNQFILHTFMAIKSSLWFCVLLMTYFTLRKSYKLFQFTMLLLCV